MRDLVLVSRKHVRFEKNIPVGGVQECGRAIFIENKVFSDLFDGLSVTPQKGFLVSMVNTDVRNSNGSYPPMMESKLMELVSDNGNRIELRGVKLIALGIETVDFSDYGISLCLANRKVVKCILHMFDRDVHIEYLDIE